MLNDVYSVRQCIMTNFSRYHKDIFGLERAVEFDPSLFSKTKKIRLKFFVGENPNFRAKDVKRKDEYFLTISINDPKFHSKSLSKSNNYNFFYWNQEIVIPCSEEMEIDVYLKKKGLVIIKDMGHSLIKFKTIDVMDGSLNYMPIKLNTSGFVSLGVSPEHEEKNWRYTLESCISKIKRNYEAAEILLLNKVKSFII